MQLVAVSIDEITNMMLPAVLFFLDRARLATTWSPHEFTSTSGYRCMGPICRQGATCTGRWSLEILDWWREAEALLDRAMSSERFLGFLVASESLGSHEVQRFGASYPPRDWDDWI